MPFSKLKNQIGMLLAQEGFVVDVKKVAKDKMKKRDGIPQMELTAVIDILKTVSSSPLGAGPSSQLGKKRFRVVVGFAAESQDLLENASEKLRSKHLDLIVANDITANDAGFAVETNRVTLLFANGTKENLPLMNKTEVAEKIIEHTSRLLE